MERINIVSPWSKTSFSSVGSYQHFRDVGLLPLSSGQDINAVCSPDSCSPLFGFHGVFTQKITIRAQGSKYPAN
jgi:hypothetical protein